MSLVLDPQPPSKLVVCCTTGFGCDSVVVLAAGAGSGEPHASLEPHASILPHALPNAGAGLTACGFGGSGLELLRLNALLIGVCAGAGFGAAAGAVDGIEKSKRSLEAEVVFFGGAAALGEAAVKKSPKPLLDENVLLGCGGGAGCDAAAGAGESKKPPPEPKADVVVVCGAAGLGLETVVRPAKGEAFGAAAVGEPKERLLKASLEPPNEDCAGGGDV